MGEIVTITQIKLKSPFHYFKLSLYALGIVKQLKKSDHLAFKKTGFWTNHYTMTLWESKDKMKEFAMSCAHLEAMKSSAKIAKEIKSVTIDGNELPQWNQAKEILSKVKGIHYNN
jgi:hypothetical protein